MIKYYYELYHIKATITKEKILIHLYVKRNKIFYCYENAEMYRIFNI